MKIAVTGGAGFVGAHLVRAYLDAGHDVLVIDNLAHGARQVVDPRARFYQADIRERKVRTILGDERPDVVSHHAVQREHILPGEQALTDADVHVRGLLNVLEGCVEAAVAKFIFASGGNSLYAHSDYALAPRLVVTPLTEHATLCPQRPQDITKLAGEWYVRYFTRQHSLPHTILRYADIYGEPAGEFSWHPFTYFLAMIQERQRPIIRGTDQDLRDHIFIDDVVRANLCALERGRNETLHISSGVGHTLKEFYGVAAHLLHSSIEPTYISSSLAAPTAVVLDNTLAQRVLGWRPDIDFVKGTRLAFDRFTGRRSVGERALPILPARTASGENAVLV